jgi:DNA-binding NtrC family response regulator
MRHLLVVDDDPASCRLMKAIFVPMGIEVEIAHSGRAATEAVRARVPDAVLLDLHLPDMTGLDVLGALRDVDAALPVVMLTAHGEVRTVVRATQLGAIDYLTKPVDPEELIVVVTRVLETRALKQELTTLRRQVSDTTGLAHLMGDSPQIARVIEQVNTVAASRFSVLILGETGTGKELVAQAIHKASERSAEPFLAVDCGAIPEALLESELFGHEKGAFTGAAHKREGRFRLAQGGTLFLDEVGNLPLALQAKLLRVLESRELQALGATSTTLLDVRFLAATNDDLRARAQDGRFRADLFFRLAQYTIALPPLRTRAADVAQLAERFVREASVELRRPMQGVSPEARALLEAHPWPGNVRELRNVMRQAVLESSGLVLERPAVERALTSTSMPAQPTMTSSEGASVREPQSLREAAEAAARNAEGALIRQALMATKGNKTHAARALQTDYKTLHTKMRALGIDAKDFTD